MAYHTLTRADHVPLVTAAHSASEVDLVPAHAEYEKGHDFIQLAAAKKTYHDVRKVFFTRATPGFVLRLLGVIGGILNSIWLIRSGTLNYAATSLGDYWIYFVHFLLTGRVTNIFMNHAAG